jgi:hypothetical protein
MSEKRIVLSTLQYIVEPSKSSNTQCKTCAQKIITGIIRIVINRCGKAPLYFHLNCFDHINQYLIKDDLIIKLSGNDLEIFEKWLEDWNKNYYCLDYKPIKQSIPKQSLNSLKVPNKRVYLEIFKFLNLQDILKSITFVNKQFYQTTWSEELWEFLLKRDFSVSCSESHPKQVYATNFSLACVDCLKMTSIDDFFRCPFLKKTICATCYNCSKYDILIQSDLQVSYGIDFDKLDIEACTTDYHNKVVYSCVFEDRLKRFRKAQKEKVVEMMKVLGPEHPALADVLNIDVDQMDIKTDLMKNHRKVINYNIPYVQWPFFEKIFHYIRSGKGKITQMNIKKHIEHDFKKLSLVN